MKETKKEEKRMIEHGKHEHGHGGGWEPQNVGEIKELLDAVGKTIPELLKSVTDNLYGPEAAKKYAQAIAEFYKALREAGMSDEQAFQMAREYMQKFSMGGMIGDLIGSSGMGGSRKHKEIKIEIGNDSSDEDEESDDDKKS